MPHIDSFRVTTSDGVSLAGWHVPARGTRRGVLVCGHAMMATSRYFHSGGFAAELAAQGVDVVGFDFRGHGDSVPPDPRSDSWGLEHYADRDLPAVLEATRDRLSADTSEITYLGHSLGGVAMLAALGRGTARVGRLTLWATSLWLPGPDGSWLRRGVLELAAGAARIIGYVPARWLRLGSSDEPLSYAKQLSGWARDGRFRSPSGFDYESALADVGVPTWGVVALGDRLCRPADALRFIDAIPGATLREVGRARGDAIDPDHFTLFTRRELAPLWRELAQFSTGAC